MYTCVINGKNVALDVKGTTTMLEFLDVIRQKSEIPAERLQILTDIGENLNATLYEHDLDEDCKFIVLEVPQMHLINDDEKNGDDHEQHVAEDAKEKEPTNEDEVSNLRKIIGLLKKEFGTIKGNYNTDTEKLNAMDAKQLIAFSTEFSEWSDEFKKLEEEMVKCQVMTSELQKAISVHITVNVQKYQKWSMRDVEIWLMTLEKGRFEKYIEGLIAGFQSDNIEASNLPDLDQGDIRAFGVQDFKDRKALKEHFQSLAANTNDIEGTITEFV